MFEFVIQKIKNKRWMVLSLLLGNILLISMLSATQIYIQAVLQRTLSTNFDTYVIEENKHPGNVYINSDIKKDADILENFLYFFAEPSHAVVEGMSLPIVNDITEMFVVPTTVVLEDDENIGETDSVQLRVGFLSGMEERINIVHGEMYGTELEPDGSIGVIISETTLIKNNLFVGDQYTFERLKYDDGSQVRVTVKGVFENSSSTDSYWVTSPALYFDNLFMDMSLFESLFLSYENPAYNLSVKKVLQLDYTSIKTGDALSLLSQISRQTEKAEDADIQYSTNFTNIVRNHIAETQRLNLTILVLLVPICILLAVFIFMVSRQMIENELTEIAVFKSRGANKFQILKIYFIQSVLISVASIVVGLPLGLLICQLLGSSTAFLEFVNRAHLPATINLSAVLIVIAAAVFSVITMVIPAVKHSSVGIVQAKQKKQQRFKMRWWEKTGVDIILIVVSCYSWFSYNSQKESIAQRVVEDASLDPLLFFSSSLFIIGVGLLMLRFFPLVMKAVFFLTKSRLSPSAYLSFKRVINTGGNQGFIMMFIIMTISLGIFSSVCARTINSNEENRIIYENGADIVIKEVWESNADLLGGAVSDEELFYYEPDFAKYSEIDGVESMTKVLTIDNIQVNSDNGNFKNTTLIGIHTKEFGETAMFKDGLLDYHWYEYLNAISQNPEAVLLSSNAAEEFGLEVGDTIYYSDAKNNRARGIVYAFVDYWPSYIDAEKSLADDGVEQKQNRYLIVGHLSYNQSVFTNIPYEVWINMADSALPVYEFIEENSINIQMFKDTASDIAAQKNDPIFQGTNGLLTVGFIMILLQCAVGFLIYWILSIFSRQLQFGIFRAMGMSMREIVTMLITEQLFVSGYSVLVGTAVGFAAAYLFVPLIELGYASTVQTLPLEIVVSLADNVRIFAVIAVTIIICLTALSAMISRLRIAEALKLGED